MTLKALILHDDDQVASVMQDLLEREGFEVEHVRDPYDAMRLATVGRPELAVIGLTALLERDLELVTMLTGADSDTHVLVCFPALLRERAARALAAGAHAYLPEPFYPGELTALAAGVRARVARPTAETDQTSAAASETDRLPSAERRAASEARTAEPGEVEALAAGVAHVIRNPLQILELLLGGAEDGLDDKDLAAIREQTGRIASVVAALSRYGGGRRIEHRSVDANELLRDAFAWPKRRGEPRINVDPDPDLGTLVGAREPLREGLHAALARAVRVTPARASVSVRARERGGVLTIDVADGGPTLDESALARLFHPSEDLEELNDGSWLELPSLASVIRSHGGSIRAEAGRDGGTTVVIRLPLRPVTEGARA